MHWYYTANYGTTAKPTQYEFHIMKYFLYLNFKKNWQVATIYGIVALFVLFQVL